MRYFGSRFNSEPRCSCKSSLAILTQLNLTYCSISRNMHCWLWSPRFRQWIVLRTSRVLESLLNCNVLAALTTFFLSAGQFASNPSCESLRHEQIRFL